MTRPCCRRWRRSSGTSAPQRPRFRARKMACSTLASKRCRSTRRCRACCRCGCRGSCSERCGRTRAEPLSREEGSRVAAERRNADSKFEFGPRVGHAGILAEGKDRRPNLGKYYRAENFAINSTDGLWVKIILLAGVSVKRALIADALVRTVILRDYPGFRKQISSRGLIAKSRDDQVFLRLISQ